LAGDVFGEVLEGEVVAWVVSVEVGNV
jgi:hypothetical protein